MISTHDTHSLPEKKTLSPSLGQVIIHWQAPEHEPLELGPRSRIIVTVLLIAVIAYALFTNSPLMAITFILIGIVGYLTMHHEPRIMDCAITSRGVLAGKQFYAYANLHSFHVYTDPPFENLLSLHTESALVTHVHVPIMGVNMETIEQTLSSYIPEEKHEPSLVDSVEKLLHI